MGSLGKEEVPSRDLTEKDMELFEKNNTLLESLEVPQLYDKSNPNARIFFALADGTENDLSDPSKFTNVAKLEKELKRVSEDNPHIRLAYKEGVGTQDNALVAKADAVFSFSFKDRANDLYEKFSEQATAWKKENKDAEISIVHVGFSRGCGVSAYLNQKIHNEGILDTSYETISNGKAVYSGKKLVEPNVTKQAMVAYDPVLTNMKHKDFKLSDSTVSVLQINANDEKRTLFPVSHFIKEGLSANKNSINIASPGSHSDVGGSYALDGLGKVTRDIQNKYLNGLTGKDNLKKIELSSNAKDYGIHDSSKHHVIYRTQNPRAVSDAVNHSLGDKSNHISTNKIVMTSLALNRSYKTTKEVFAKFKNNQQQKLTKQTKNHNRGYERG